MKTIKKNSEYKRVSDKTADEMVSFKGWSFCPKQEWKQNVRDVAAPIVEAKETAGEKPIKQKKEKKSDYKQSKNNKKNGK